MSEMRLIEETVARCVSIMVYYLGSGRSTQSRGVMTNEVQSIARWATGLGLSSQAIHERIVRPVKAELIARYGSEVGERLYNEFLRVFESVNKPTPVLRPSLV